MQSVMERECEPRAGTAHQVGSDHMARPMRCHQWREGPSSSARCPPRSEAVEAAEAEAEAAAMVSAMVSAMVRRAVARRAVP
jgi:hypothetical protein